MAKRKTISRTLRFEVFKRDRFTCQYCGRKAPDIVLHIDHITPVAKGGTNDLFNLVAACEDCNGGKSDKKLDDASAVAKQRNEIEQRAERIEQIDMIFEWQRSLATTKDHTRSRINELIAGLYTPCVPSPRTLTDFVKLCNQYGLDIVVKSIYTAHDQYAEYDEDGDITFDSFEVCMGRIPGICRSTAKYADVPLVSRMLYTRKILMNRFGLTIADIDDDCHDIYRYIYDDEQADKLEHLAKQCESFAGWFDQVLYLYTTEKAA